MTKFNILLVYYFKKSVPPRRTLPKAKNQNKGHMSLARNYVQITRNQPQNKPV